MNNKVLCWCSSALCFNLIPSQSFQSLIEDKDSFVDHLVTFKRVGVSQHVTVDFCFFQHTWVCFMLKCHAKHQWKLSISSAQHSTG